MAALRDTALVEQRLLRTLEPLLGILETSFYRTDDSGGIIRAVTSPSRPKNSEKLFSYIKHTVNAVITGLVQQPVQIVVRLAHTI